MSNCLRLKKALLYICFPAIISGCAPLVPDNYLGPNNIGKGQIINGYYIRPRLIPISAQILETPAGQRLLTRVLHPQPYRIGAFDNLDIIVWGHPELSTVSTSTIPLPGTKVNLAGLSVGSANPSTIVQPDGTIFYPYVGHLKIAGLTVDEGREAITKRLSIYIRNPQVTVQVSKFRNRNVYVLGEVSGPGMQPITDKPLTLLQAISSAGGINTGSADPTHIFIVRGSYQRPDIYWINAQSPQSLLIAEQFPLQENDIVYVSASMLNSVNKLVNEILPQFSTYYVIKGYVQK